MVVSLRELLTANFFSKSEILAGEKGISKKVNYVTVLEAPDGYKYIEKGALAVTTAYCLKNNIEETASLIENLSKRNAAALGINLRYYNNQLPKIIKQKAEELDFTIISIPEEYSFKKIIDFIMCNLYSRQTKRFLHVEKVYEQFVKSIEKNGLKGIAQKLHEWTGLNSAVIYGNDRFQYPNKFLSDNICNNSSLWQTSIIDEYGLDDSKEKKYHYSYKIGEELTEWIGVELNYKDSLKGYLWLYKGNRSFEKNDYLLLEIAAKASKIEMKILSVIEKDKQVYLKQLLKGKIETWENAAIRAKGLKWDLPREASVVHIKPSKNIYYPNNQILQTINNYFVEILRKKLITGTYENGIIILLPKKSIYHKKIAEDLLKYLNKNYVNSDFLFGIGRPKSFNDLKTSYKEAKHAIKIGPIISNGSGIFHFSDLGFYRLISYPKEFKNIKDFYEDYIKPLILFDQENKTELTKTLQLYFDNECSYKLTAAKLHLHPNSIGHRIKTIENICEVNLKSNDDRLNIGIALKLAPIFSNVETH